MKLLNHLNLDQKQWVEINDDARGTYNKKSQIKFQTRMLKSSLCEYTDAYILVNGTITVTGAGDDATAIQVGEKNKQVILKNFLPFSDCISEINNTSVDNLKDLNVVMPMYNLVEYSSKYYKQSGRLWQYYRDEPKATITDSESFKFKAGITVRTLAAGNTKDVEIATPLKHLNHFWTILEILLIYCEINLTITCSENSVITDPTGARTFTITDTKLYISVVTMSTKDNTKLMQQPKLEFKGKLT